MTVYIEVVNLMSVVLVAMTGFYLVFTMMQSTDTMRGYYLVLPLIGMAAVIQLIKTVIAMILK